MVHRPAHAQEAALTCYFLPRRRPSIVAPFDTLVACEPEVSPAALLAFCRGIRRAAASAASRATSGRTLVYVSDVSTMEECPSISWTTFMSAPAARANVAAPWRRSCNRIGGRPARLTSRSTPAARELHRPPGSSPARTVESRNATGKPAAANGSAYNFPYLVKDRRRQRRERRRGRRWMGRAGACGLRPAPHPPKRNDVPHQGSEQPKRPGPDPLACTNRRSTKTQHWTARRRTYCASKCCRAASAPRPQRACGTDRLANEIRSSPFAVRHVNGRDDRPITRPARKVGVSLDRAKLALRETGNDPPPSGELRYCRRSRIGPGSGNPIRHTPGVERE